MIAEILSNMSALVAVLAMAVTAWITWRGRHKTTAEIRKTDADTYEVWRSIADGLREQIVRLETRIDTVERENSDLLEKYNAALARIQSLEHDNRVLRERLSEYEDSDTHKRRG